MKRKNRIIQLKYNLDRYDRFLQVADIKGNLLMAYHFFILGALLLNFDSLESKFIESPLPFSWIAGFACFISIVSLLFVFKSTHPFLNQGSSVDSLIFFNSVAKRTVNKFKADFKNQTLKEYEEDLICQVHIIASGLNVKFKTLKTAGIICYLHLLIGSILLITLI